MHWPEFHHRRQRSLARTAIDIDEVLAVGLRDRDAARRSIDQLRQERHRVEREQQVLHARNRHRTPREIRTLGRAGTAASEMGAYQLTPAPADASANDSLLGEQLVAIEARSEAINDALGLLHTYLREQR